jgi:hypothetical protein
MNDEDYESPEEDTIVGPVTKKGKKKTVEEKRPDEKKVPKNINKDKKPKDKK